MVGEQLQRSVSVVQGERFGTNGMFELLNLVFPVKTETAGVVDYSAHVIRREKNPHLGKEKLNGEAKQMVLVSGLDTTGQDWLKMAAQLMEDMPDVEQITLLDHPSTSGVRHERRDVALNTTSFENSAKVISKAMEAMMETGDIKKGQIAIGISTGCAVLEELTAMNPKLIDTLILCAPAGMLDRTPDKIMKGGAHGGLGYIMQYVGDRILRNVSDKKLNPLSQRQPIEPVGIVKLIPHTADRRIPTEMLDGIKRPNMMFEKIFTQLRKVPDFYQHFAGMWGDSDPHVNIVGADYKKDLALVSKNTTEKAREKIQGKKVVLVLGMDDQAVPPAEFLEQVDVDALSMIKDKNEKADATISSIISRLKGKFKNNADTTVVLAAGGPRTHVEIKTNTELYGPVIANILEPVKPELSLSGDALQQWFGKSN